MANKYVIPVIRYALVICRNKQNRFLSIQQTNGKWWIPGGKVQPHQTFYQAALRQCEQQSGLKVQLKGIIRVDYGKFNQINAWRTIFYAQPIQQSLCNIKRKNDNQSKIAQFLTLQQIQKIQPLWRGRQIYDFAKYLSQDGQYYPFAIFKQNFKHNQKMI